MKTGALCVVAATGLLIGSGSSVMAERVAYRELPEQVRKTLQKNRDDIKRIETFNHDGKTVYEVQMDKKGADRFVYVDQNGNRLNDPGLRNERLSAAGNLKLNDLPKPVQTTFKKQTGSAKLSSIDLDSEDGKDVYNIHYTRNGKNQEIRINEDGSLAESETAQSSEESTTTQTSDNSETAVGFDRPLTATQKVDFKNVPEAVKRTVRDLAGSNRIEDAERGTLDGRTIYEIAFKKDGQHNEVRVAEDGSVVKRIAGTNIRFPGALSVNEVPVPVQKAIKEQVGSGEVNDIDKKTVDGKTVYEVGFKKESGGAQHEIQIAEDGTVIGEPAGAEKK